MTAPKTPSSGNPAYYTQDAEAVLGEEVICRRCGATMQTYAVACAAALDDPCPGFVAIEEAIAAGRGRP